MIGAHILVLCESSRSSWRDYLKGLAKYSRLNGARWIFHLNPPAFLAPDMEKNLPSTVRRMGIRGIMDGLDDPDLTERLLSTGLPCLTHNPSQKEPFGKYIGVPDNAQIGKMGADHFLDKHFTHFAYCGTGPFSWSQERSELFIDTIVSAGHRVQVYKQPALRGRYSWEKERSHLAEWLKGLPKPIGLMADTDDRGHQVLEACQVAGVKVPEEAAVLGVGDDDFICEFSCPPMSSIRVNAETVGYQMAEFFARLLNGENLPAQTFFSQPVGVTERQSTNVLAIDDDVVKEAVRFIRQNSMRPLGVLDVAEAVSVTVRTLDRRFKKTLGRSVYNEIARVRIEQVCRMLTESSLSIFDIAHKMGYSDPVDLNRAFKREKGMAPSAYRAAHTSI